MSLRRCVSHSSLSAHHALRLAGRRRPNTGYAILTAAHDASLVPARQVGHDETDNIGTQVTFNVLNQQLSKNEEDNEDTDAAEYLYVTRISTQGFRLANMYNIIGPCVLFPRTVLSWNVGSAKDITPESLTLFSLLEPKLDVLVIGIGDGSCKPDAPKIIAYCRRLGINVEILKTEEACATFNFLNGEYRHVAAALIPPEDISLFHPQRFIGERPIDYKHPLDALNSEGGAPYAQPRNWFLNPGGRKDADFNWEKAKERRDMISNQEAAEMNYTEAKMKEELAAMEDRGFLEDGSKILTPLEQEAKDLLAKDLLEYEKTGVASPRLQFEMNYAERKYDKVEDRGLIMFLDGPKHMQMTSGDVQKDGGDRSHRYLKKFDKMYDDAGAGDGSKTKLGDRDGSSASLDAGTTTITAPATTTTKTIAGLDEGARLEIASAESAAPPDDKVGADAEKSEAGGGGEGGSEVGKGRGETRDKT